jgi:hypothetical protein
MRDHTASAFHAIISILAAMVLSSSGCSQSDSWSEALEQTSPANPERSEISAPGRVETQETRAAASRRTEAAPTAEERAGEERRGETGEAEGDATLLVLLQGPRDCFAGAVRVYVDGRYVGQAGADGRLQVRVQSGAHNLEVWDSRGRWEAKFVVDGQHPLRRAPRHGHLLAPVPGGGVAPFDFPDRFTLPCFHAFP